MTHRYTFEPCDCASRIEAKVALNKLRFSDPHRPRSVLITTMPTDLIGRSSVNGCLKSRFTWRKWPIILRIFSAYGRAARMRSCALRILLAATIFRALVILRVFLMLE